MSDRLVDILSRPPADALRGFLSCWYGVDADRLAAQSVPPEVPRCLHRLYQVAAVAPGFWSQNRLLPARDLREEDDHLVFYVENQDVAFWGIEADNRDAEDPPVWCQENAVGREWMEDAPSVSVFAVQMAVLEGVFGSLTWASALGLPARVAADVLASFRELPLPAWRWVGPVRFFASDRCLAFTLPTVPHAAGDDEVGLYVGARRPGDLQFVEAYRAYHWHVES